ncbi:MAG: hypothetical protein QMC80_08545 [Thermoplasmatales archaeon]|nr:hypothetical protein [Thermoplasmatales archaeon]
MNLKVGWNSVGWFNKTGTDAQTLMNDIGSNCTAIAVWNATTQKFDVYQSGGTNFAIKYGDGVLVYMEGEEIWTNG